MTVLDKIKSLSAPELMGLLSCVKYEGVCVATGLMRWQGYGYDDDILQRECPSHVSCTECVEELLASEVRRSEWSEDD